jgi:membrane protein YdbS with pleckstrin-like domain
MKNKNGTTFLSLLLIAIGLTILGFWADADPLISLSTTIFEFIMMTIIIFLLITVIYFVTTFTVKKVKQLLS